MKDSVKKNIWIVVRVMCVILAFVAVLGVSKTAEAKENAKWNYKKTLKKTSGVFTYHAYPSKKGKEAWIYKIDIKKKKKPASVTIPKKMEGREVTCIGAKIDGDNKGVNIFGVGIEREHDYYRRSVTNKTIKKVVIPKSVKVIQPSSFCGLAALKSITIPKKVKELKEETFYACAKLEEVNLPVELKKLDPAAFQDCPSLKKMKLSKKNKTYKVEGNCVVLKKNQTLVYALPGDETFVVPNGIERIGKYAFNNCASQKIEISASVKEIEGQAFYRPLLGSIKTIKDVVVSADNQTYAKDGQCIYNKLDQSLSVAIPDENGKLRISDQVHSLTNTHSLVNCDYANEGYEEVVFPSTLELIIAPSFKDLSSARNVYFQGEKPPRVLGRVSGYAALPIFTHVYVPEQSESLYLDWYKENHCHVDKGQWHTFAVDSKI